MTCTGNCNQGRGCTCRAPAPMVHSENDVLSLYRFFRRHCAMGRWKALRKAFYCWW